MDTDIDILTEDEKIFAILLAKDDTFGQGSRALVVRCGHLDDNTDAEVFVTFEKELEGNIWHEIQYRFDDSEVQTERWSLSTDNEAVFVESPIEFIWQLINSSELIIREENGDTLVFDIAGLANALYPHRDKCSWIEP